MITLKVQYKPAKLKIENKNIDNSKPIKIEVDSKDNTRIKVRKYNLKIKHIFTFCYMNFLINW